MTYSFIISLLYREIIKWGEGTLSEKKNNLIANRQKGYPEKTKYTPMLDKCEKMFVITKVIQTKSTFSDLA